ncbi:MAG: hypothetical protein KAR30_00330, partial [Gammaproteobacteria bacterium]|nr:hypothetical protein [Gammaproteobacteria bacterium]
MERRSTPFILESIETDPIDLYRRSSPPLPGICVLSSKTQGVISPQTVVSIFLSKGVTTPWMEEVRAQGWA